MSEVAHALFYGIEDYITDFKFLPEEAHFNSLSMNAFVCIWADLVVKPIAP